MNVGILMIHFQWPFKCLFTISTQLLTHFNQRQICGKVFSFFLLFGLCDFRLPLASVTFKVALLPLMLVQQINPHSGPLALLSSNASEAEGI